MYKAKSNIKVVHTVAELRERLYKQGFTCDGIEFIRFKRSAGSSRVGKCLFIDKKLFSRMHVWGLGGICLKRGQQIDLASLEAYTALTLSSLIDTLSIRPVNFLIINDYESVFKDKVIATRIVDGWLKTDVDNVEIKNSIWDGQSLIDISLLGNRYQDKGMLLLRNRFFKSACFNCNIQKFFSDNGITSINQLNGKTYATDISDVKVITTASSIKYLKFGFIDEWLNMVASYDTFGIVKYDAPTHFFGGDMVQLHYQLLNTLQLSRSEVQQLINPSLDYLTLLRENPAAFRFHIGYDIDRSAVGSIETTSDVVYKMLGVTEKFCDTKLYYDYREDVLSSFMKNLRYGHILVNGNYSVLLGNPMEMLHESIGKFTGDSLLGVGKIHSLAFGFEKTLLGCRSPHVTMGNIWIMKNINDANIQSYFNLTKEIVCINSINENVLQRLNGCDFDADTVLITDNEILISAAQRNYGNFLVPTSLVEARKVSRVYTSEEQADLDVKTSVNKIGEIINLSQELNTKLWDRLNNGDSINSVMELYYDIAKLSVMSGIEIDKAKKEFDVDNEAEIKRLKKKYEERDDDDKLLKPNFMGKIARSKGYYDSERKNYKLHDTTMDYLQRCLNKYRKKRNIRDFIPFSSLLLPNEGYNTSEVNYAQVKKIINTVRDMKTKIQSIWTEFEQHPENETKYLLISEIKKERTELIKRLRINTHTAYYLLLTIEDEKYRDIRRSLFYSLFSTPNKDFLTMIEKSKTSVCILAPSQKGDVEIYNKRFSLINNDSIGILVEGVNTERKNIMRYYSMDSVF